MSTIGVAIPSYITCDEDLSLLRRCLTSLNSQSEKPSQIVISCDSDPEYAKEIVREFPNLNISVIRNLNTRGIASNSNNAVSRLNSRIVHILHQDDFLINTNLYQDVQSRFLENEFSWLIVGGKNENANVIVPKFTEGTILGFNAIGGPSCLFVNREKFINFDSRFSMHVDVVNYQEYFNAYGNPEIIENPEILYGNPSWRVSKTATKESIYAELLLIIESGLAVPETIKRVLTSGKFNAFQRLLILKLLKKVKLISSIHFYYIYSTITVSRIAQKINHA